MSQNSICIYISKGGGASPCIQLHPLYWWGGAVAAPQTGLTSCQIGDIGHPRKVRGNPRYIPGNRAMLCTCFFMYPPNTCHFYWRESTWVMKFISLLSTVWLQQRWRCHYFQVINVHDQQENIQGGNQDFLKWRGASLVSRLLNRHLGGAKPLSKGPDCPCLHLCPPQSRTIRPGKWWTSVSGWLVCHTQTAITGLGGPLMAARGGAKERVSW